MLPPIVFLILHMVDHAIGEWETQYVNTIDDVVGSWAARRGGIHQQLSAVALSGIEPPVALPRPPSVLGSRLSELNAWGLLPASRLQELAAGAIADGSDHPELKALAAIGAHGDQPQNCARFGIH